MAPPPEGAENDLTGAVIIGLLSVIAGPLDLSNVLADGAVIMVLPSVIAGALDLSNVLV